MSEPIYALDLDEDFLSHIAKPDSWTVIQGEQVTVDLLEDEFVREVFAWQKHHVREHTKPATAAVLEHEFDLELVEPEAAIGDLLDRLRERYARNQQRQDMVELIALQKEAPLDVPQALIRKGKKLSDLLTKRGEMFGSGDLARAQSRYDKKVLAGPGASFGFEDLDDYFFGMRGVTILLAAPKTGKSWVMCKGTLTNVIEGHYPWLYSLELPAEETDMRIRCLMANVPWWKYIRNGLTPQDWTAIKETSEYLDGLGAYRIYKPTQGYRGIDELVYTARDAGADVVFIDQLQYVENEKGQSIGSLNDTGAYWDVLNRARDLSDDGPICFAHQFNRSAMYADAMPQVEQAKGSSSIEEVSTLVLGMYANKDMRRSGITEVGTLISRNHSFASWEMQVELNHGCSFEIIGRVVEDED